MTKPSSRGYVIGVDASRSRSGGAVSHLRCILDGSEPREYGVERVHLWGYKELLNAVPDLPFLTKHLPPSGRGGIARQLIWQRFTLDQIAKDAGCDLMFNTDAGTVCRFLPCITLSQDMLSFEPGERQRYGWGKRRLRLEVLKYVQGASLRKSSVAVFLTDYAAQMIESVVGPFRKKVVIPHGVGKQFLNRSYRQRVFDTSSTIRLLYISNAAMYKHQWHVVRAIHDVRKNTGYDLRIKLVGGGAGKADQILNRTIAELDPSGCFVERLPFVENRLIPSMIDDADMFVFASSCENMPVTLIEAMARGIPTVCSSRGPMPETIKGFTDYFDPEDPKTISKAILNYIASPSQANDNAIQAQKLADTYSWERCARSTWELLSGVASEFSNR